MRRERAGHGNSCRIAAAVRDHPPYATRGRPAAAEPRRREPRTASDPTQRTGRRSTADFRSGHRPVHPPGLVPPRVARTVVAMTLRGYRVTLRAGACQANREKYRYHWIVRRRCADRLERQSGRTADGDRRVAVAADPSAGGSAGRPNAASPPRSVTGAAPSSTVTVAAQAQHDPRARRRAARPAATRPADAPGTARSRPTGTGQVTTPGRHLARPHHRVGEHLEAQHPQQLGDVDVLGGQPAAQHVVAGRHDLHADARAGTRAGCRPASRPPRPAPAAPG